MVESLQAGFLPFVDLSIRPKARAQPGFWETPLSIFQPPPLVVTPAVERLARPPGLDTSGEDPPDPSTPPGSSSSATESELQNDLPDVCYAWSKKFGPCGDDSVPAGSDAELVCVSSTIQRSHICHICCLAGKTEFHRGSECTNEEAKELQKVARKRRKKWHQDLKDRNEEMSTKYRDWTIGKGRGKDREEEEQEEEDEPAQDG